MALPANFQVITVTGSYVDLTGVAVNGSIQFDIEDFTALRDPASNVVILAKPLTASIASGIFSLSIPATNDPDITPSFTYKVTESFPTLSITRTYRISIAYDGPNPLDVADITPL